MYPSRTDSAVVSVVNYYSLDVTRKYSRYSKCIVFVAIANAGRCSFQPGSATNTTRVFTMLCSVHFQSLASQLEDENVICKLKQLNEDLQKVTAKQSSQ